MQSDTQEDLISIQSISALQLVRSSYRCPLQVQQLVRQLEGKLKLLGVATSPVVMVGLTWVLLKYAGWR